MRRDCRESPAALGIARHWTSNSSWSAHVHIPDSTSALTSATPTHAAFVEALAALSSDADPDWTTMSAALLTLRVVDAWSQPGAVTDEELALRVATILPVVDAVDDDELRTALRTLIGAVGSRDAIELVESRLLVLGRTLEARARWELPLEVPPLLLAVHRERGTLGPAAHPEPKPKIRIPEGHGQRGKGH